MTADRIYFPRVKLFALLLILGTRAPAFAGSDCQVEIFPQEFSPGQAVLIRLTAASKISAVEGTLGDQKILFFASDGENLWEGLGGIDLQASPGKQELSYQVRFEDGSSINAHRSLLVLKKEFPEERIQVEEKYVHLSEKDLDRYRGEQRILSSIYQTQSQSRSWNHGFEVPVNVETGSRFGLRRIVNGEPRSPHSGADLKAGLGTPVGASSAGRVVFAGDLFFSGNTVILDHGGGLYTLYAHLSKVNSVEGQSVRRGEVVGLVGATGRVTGPHLHWGVKLNGARVDPFSLVSLPVPYGNVSAGEDRATKSGPTNREMGSQPGASPASGQKDESRSP